MNFKFVFLFFFLQTFIPILFGQELPPVETFMPEIYEAEDQNWGITQAEDESIYFANNKGLLTYNGARWKLYDSPNSTIMRSVKSIDSMIFSGSHMDFGYWVKDIKGNLSYTSIVEKKDLAVLEDEEFWNILKLERSILFQSLKRIYIYDKEKDSISIIKSNNGINKIYKVDNRIYFQKNNQGIFSFESGKERLVSDHPLLRESKVISIFKHHNQLGFLTEKNGFFQIYDKKIVPWNKELNQKLKQYVVYNSIQLKNGNFILGTVSNGIIYISSGFQIMHKIDQSRGLGNNTVLSLFEDKVGNVWLGLDRGISNVNFSTQLRVYSDVGVLGTVYASLLDGDILYLGTNQGLFYKNLNFNRGFELIQGTEGQVWFLKKLKNTIFCGHNTGTFTVKNKKIEHIFRDEGTWQIKEIENSPNLLIQGNYEGLSILEYKNNRWQTRNKLEGFKISSRYLEFSGSKSLLMSHEYKGVYQLKMDDDYKKVISHRQIGIPKSAKSSLVKFDNRILYGASDGVFYFDTNQQEFFKENTLSDLYNTEEYISGKLVVTNNKLFAFAKDRIAYAEKGSLTDIQLSSIYHPQNLRLTKEGYENILYIGGENYLIGNSTGYMISELNTENIEQYNIRLDKVSAHQLNKKHSQLSLSEESKDLTSFEHHLKFSFSISNYNKYLPSQYRYRLVGFNENWTQWSSSTEATFENLPFGDYTFQVKGRVGKSETENTISYRFVIEKPWYQKTTAIVVYIVMGFLSVIFFHVLHRRYYKIQRQKLLKQKEKELEIKQLENEQQLMYYKNLDLQKDIEAKNRELGMSAMNLVKRNELLGHIKKELSTAKNIEDISKVIKLINRNLNTNDDWKLFEEAFNTADKDFIKKLKTLHSNLTSNDLRLCTYLRLNLSSKEIAPLLNISLRSVEVKRYRLRKKMNLPHEASLTDYILAL